jgi:hypothetical protein
LGISGLPQLLNPEIFSKKAGWEFMVSYLVLHRSFLSEMSEKLDPTNLKPEGSVVLVSALA